MTVDDEVVEHQQPDPARALASYVASMRRRRRWYLAIIAVVVAVGVVVAVAVWSTGEVTHVHLRTAGQPAPSVALATPAAQVSVGWQSSDATAIGTPVTGGTVVTYSKHTVTGRDAATGKEMWSYLRTDRTVCTAIQAGSNTLAIYEKDGNCDELTTLDTGTGARRWERTLADNGHPSYQVSSSTLLIVTDQAVHAIDPGGGIDRWNYAEPSGCHTRSAALGTAGTLIGQQCADGPHLLLHDPNANDESKKPKPVTWRLDHTATVPVAADSFIGALDPATHQLVIYDRDKGKVTSRTTLNPPPSATGTISRTAAGTSELVWIGGTAYALDGSGNQLWTAQVSASPTVTAPDGNSVDPELAGGIVLAPGSAGIMSLDGASGTTTTQYSVAAVPAASQIYPVGNGLLVAGSSTTLYR